MTATRSIEDNRRAATIEAMKSMGKENFQEAAAYMKAGLDVDPTNRELLGLEALVSQCRRSSQASTAIDNERSRHCIEE